MPSSSIAMALLLAAGILAGCHTTSMVSVPSQKTVAEQYRYAVDYRETKSLRFITDEKRLHKAREVVRQVFARVPENFPADRTFTPLARLEIIEMEGGLDLKSIGEKENKGQIRRTIKDLEALGKQYPEHTYVQVKTLYDRGLCHKLLVEYGPAKECFRLARDGYIKNPNKEIENIARRAAHFYNLTDVRE